MSNPIHMSEFQKLRQSYEVTMPDLLKCSNLTFESSPVPCKDEIKALFPTLCSSPLELRKLKPAIGKEEEISTPLRVGVVLSGGQAPGGHNVISGVYDFIKEKNANSQLFGFLSGPHGIFSGNYIEIRSEYMDTFRNQGGFDMICSGRHKIETPEQFASSLKVCKKLDLHGLIVIGGDDSNTNAALLGEYFAKHGSSTKIIGAPKTIDGDLKNEHIEISFGFDTACKTFSEMIGNIGTDCVSSKKYYHFIRLMGRAASHITLECALQTRPTAALFGEEIAAKKIKLHDLVEDLSKIIIKRAEAGKDYGIILVPEGLIEFFPDVKVLIEEINEILSEPVPEGQTVEEFVLKALTADSKIVFEFLPKSISEQLLLDRDPHGNVQVAKIDTERLLILLVQSLLVKKTTKGEYKGSFKPQSHYFGYEGRCALPSNFDTNYCYGLGQTAGALISMGFTGYMTTLKGLKNHPSKWEPAGVPLMTMMHVERRKGRDVPVIAKSLVEMDSHIFQTYEAHRDHWATNDCFRSPGPIQFGGPYGNQPTYLIMQKSIEELASPEEDKNTVQYAYKNEKDASEVALLQANNRAVIPTILEDGRFKAHVKHSFELASHQLSEAAHKTYPHYCASKTQQRYVELVDTNTEDSKNATIRPPEISGPRIGVVFCGRQSPGGNNVIDGLLRYTEKNDGTVIGFIGGTVGLFEKNHIVVTDELYKLFRNQGGFDFLGRTADKIREPSQLEAAKAAVEDLKLDGLVLVGATHTLTDALLVTDYFLANGVKTSVIGVPCTVDGNVHHELLEAVVGFDTASKVYSQLIGNIMTDAASATKYWYFMRLMGRDPSHLVLECALQTHPNHVIISEEIAAKGHSLDDIVDQVADTICRRAAEKKNFGTVLIPEGLLSHLPYFKQLISELNSVFKGKNSSEQAALSSELYKNDSKIKECLSPWNAAVFLSLPEFTRKQMLMERQSDGGIQLSQIETERLISYLVGKELKRRKDGGKYEGSFSAVTHFFGYQGRCSLPSDFDASLASTYGYTAGALVALGLTGYCVSARGLLSKPEDWSPAALPLLALLQTKEKSVYGNETPVIPSSEVNLKGKPYEELLKGLANWILEDHYSNPGPIQFYGVDRPTLTLTYSQRDYLSLLSQVDELCQKIQASCEFGAAEDVLKVAITSLGSLSQTLEIVKKSSN